MSRPDKIYHCKPFQVCWYMLQQWTWIGVAIFFHWTIFAQCWSSSSHTSENDNWELKIEDRKLRFSYEWLVSNTVNDSRLLKNPQIQIETSPVNTGLCIAFKHHISFATNLAANLGCNQFRILSKTVPKLLCNTNWSSCAVWWNLIRLPFLGQVIDLDLLLCTGFNNEHEDLFLCTIFTKRPINDGKIKQSNEHCFGLLQVLANCI